MNPAAKKKPRSAPEGIEETIKAYDRELSGFLSRRLRGREESEDIRQEIYLRMLRFTDAELVREPRAYLYRVARNVLHDKRVLAERERGTFACDGNGGVADGVTEDQTIQIDNARDLECILSKLPRLYRDMLLLRTANGLSYDEIAKELNISVHTVKKYLHTALVQCRSISLQLK